MSKPYEARTTFFCENPGGCTMMIYQGQDFYWFNDRKICSDCWQALIEWFGEGNLKGTVRQEKPRRRDQDGL